MIKIKLFYKDMTKQIEELIGKEIEFNSLVEEQEIFFDKGMRGRITDITLEGSYDDGDCYKILVDFSEWEEYNKRRSIPTFYDNAGNSNLKWHETSYYPNNKMDKIFLMGYELSGDKCIYKILNEEESKSGRGNFNEALDILKQIDKAYSEYAFIANPEKGTEAGRVINLVRGFISENS